MLENSLPKTRPLSPIPKSKDQQQSKRFADAARELECDDDKDRFEQRLKKIAKAKPKGETKG
jgi:hypothetical protein